jgi:hypothetical protein
MRQRPPRSFFILFGAFALNSAYLAHLVLGFPRLLPLVITPILLGLAVSWMFVGPREIMMVDLNLLLGSSLLNVLTLLSPVLLGLFPDPLLADWFTYLVFYRVFGNLLLTALHLFVSSLAGLLLWGRW